MSGIDNVRFHVLQIPHVNATAAHDELEQLLRNAPLPLIAARIKRARKQIGWSHDRLGEEMGGISRRTLIGYEKGEHRPRLAMVVRIAEATGKEPRWFVDPEVDPSPFPADGERKAA